MAIREIVYNELTYSLSYEILNTQKDKCIVFLHGWGSNKEIMKQAFGNTLFEYKHIYVDLPGFGGSSIARALKTEDYANIIVEFFKSLHVKPFMIAGHSYGGKVAILLNPKNLILLSSAGIVVEKSLSIKMKIRLSKIFNIIGLKNINKFLVSKDVDNMSPIMYETFKNVVNEDFESIFKNVDSKTFIFWGKMDTATPLSSGEKISKYIKDSKFFLLDGDHFFFIKNSKIISEVIENEQL